jgi:hypothetical protein
MIKADIVQMSALCISVSLGRGVLEIYKRCVIYNIILIQIRR